MINLLPFLVLFILSCHKQIHAQTFYPPAGAVDLIEQYVTVMVTAQMVPEVTVESYFFGVVYLSVNTTYTATTEKHNVTFLIWHNVQSAISLEVYGPAGRGHVGIRLFSITAVGTGFAGADNCPIVKWFLWDKNTMQFLRDGLLYVQMGCEGGAQCQLRGQIEPRGDCFACFMHDSFNMPSITNVSTTTGIALIQMNDTSWNKHNSYSMVRIYALSRTGEGLTMLLQSRSTGYEEIALGDLSIPPPPVNSFWADNATLKKDFVRVVNVYYGPESSPSDISFLLPTTNPFILCQIYRIPDVVTQNKTKNNAFNFKIKISEAMYLTTIEIFIFVGLFFLN